MEIYVVVFLFSSEAQYWIQAIASEKSEPRASG